LLYCSIARIIKRRRRVVGVDVGYLVGDDCDEGGVVSGDAGPPRHGLWMLLPALLVFAVLRLLRIRWSSAQAEIGSIPRGGAIGMVRIDTNTSGFWKEDGGKEPEVFRCMPLKKVYNYV